MRPRTRYHRWLSIKLGQLGLIHEEEYPVGPYSIDIWLPELCVAVEVDGKMFHVGRNRDRERDAEIMRLRPDITRIVRIPSNTPLVEALEMIGVPL